MCCYHFTACTHLHIFCCQGQASDIVSHHQHQNLSEFGLVFLSYFTYSTTAEQIHQIYALREDFSVLPDYKLQKLYGRPIDIPIVCLMQAMIPTKTA